MLLIPIYVVALALAVYGYFVAGLAGVATAALTGYLVASVYTARVSSVSPMVASATSEFGRVQRVKAVLAFALMGVGVAVGGWQWGWAGALAGYVVESLAGHAIAIAAVRRLAR